MSVPVVAQVPRDGGSQVHQPRAREHARQHEVAPLLVGVEPVAARPDDGYEHHGDEAHRHHLLGALPTRRWAVTNVCCGRVPCCPPGPSGAPSKRAPRRRKQAGVAPRGVRPPEIWGCQLANWLSSLALCTALGLPRDGKGRRNSRGGQPPATPNARFQQQEPPLAGARRGHTSQGSVRPAAHTCGAPRGSQ